MTVTVNGHSYKVTVGDDVRDCVRASEIPAEAADRAVERGGSAYTRAIPQKPEVDHANGTSKVRNFLSQHVGEARAAVAADVTVNEQPMTVGDAWRQVLPEGGSVGSYVAGTVAGLFRACVLSVLYVAASSVGTRVRAGVTLALLVIAAVAGCVTAAVT